MSRNTDRNNFEYIKSVLDADDVKAPESLSEENMLAMLNNLSEDVRAAEPGSELQAGMKKDFQPVTAKKRFAPRKWLAAAACLVIALVGTLQLYQSVTAPPDTSVVNGELYTFKNSKEIDRLVSSLSKDRDGLYLLDGDMGVSINEDAEMAAGDTASDSAPLVSSNGSSDAVAKSASPSGNSADHSDTYLQVEDVDEADIVKTDGQYIYYVNDDAEVIILKAENGETALMSRVGASEIDNYISDIYIMGDILVTVGYFYDNDEEYTGIVTYDISDRKSPQLITTFCQSGNIISSRMVGDYVYLVTNDPVYKGGRTIPKCMTDGEYRDMAATDILCVPDPKQSSFIVLSAMDITSGKSVKCKTTAVFGASQDIYCNDHNLYSATYEWDEDASASCTRIVRASLDGLNVRFNATTKVRGYIDNQFSMDEKDGYFRIATTSERAGMDVNNLFVLDPDLKEAGKITGFARNESIRSVRYFGDKAYVITYEQIDPLFIIDLSDPANPRIEGEVKIDGFSTLLVPAGNGRLIGIGHATGDNGYGGEYDSGLKLVLFDISNPSEPKVVASREFEDMTSPAQDTHLALTVNSKDGWYAIPYGVYYYDESEDIDVAEDSDTVSNEDSDDIDISTDDTETPGKDAMANDGNDDIYQEPGYEAGVLVFGADDDLTIYDRHRIGIEYLARSVYIGDYIYALDREGNVSSFKFSK